MNRELHEKFTAAARERGVKDLLEPAFSTGNDLFSEDPAAWKKDEETARASLSARIAEIDYDSSVAPREEPLRQY